MSIKTSIKEHFTSTFHGHRENISLKNHWDYFFQDNPENPNPTQFQLDNSKNTNSTQFQLDNPLDFRRFSGKDLDECAELFKNVFSGDPWYDEWVSLDQSRNYLKELVANPVFEGFIIRDNSKMVAACLGHRRSWWAGKEFFVDEFFVEKGRQGHGIGSDTMNYLVKTLIEEGYVRITLLTNKKIPAETFYLKNGFYNNEKRTVMVREL